MRNSENELKPDGDFRYCIMYKCPRSGCWEPLHEWMAQRAEYDLRFNTDHYYERAIRVGVDTHFWSPDHRPFLYTFEDAQRIIDYWKNGTYSFAEFMVIAHRNPLFRQLAKS